METWAPRRSNGDNGEWRMDNGREEGARRPILHFPFSIVAVGLRIEIRRSPLQRSSAARTMQRRALVALLERVVVVASAGALALERVVAADDAEDVGVGVMAKAAAHGAPFGECHRLRSHAA